MQTPAAGEVTLLSYLMASQQMLLALIALYVYFAFFLGVLARKTAAKAPSWLAWIPIANLYLLSKVARQSLLMAALILVPLVNLVIAGKLWKGIAAARNKPAWTGWLILVPGVNLLLPMYLAAGAVTDPEAQHVAQQATATERPQFCPDCGTPLEAEQRFCGECGCDVSALSPAEPEPAGEAAAPVAAGPPAMVMRSPWAIAGILAGLAMVAFFGYAAYDSFTTPQRARQLPPMPPAMAGTLTEFPIDSIEMHPLHPDAVAVQQLGTTPVRVPTGWLPRGLQPTTLARQGHALTSATYRAHPQEPPVAITVLKAADNPVAAAQEIANEVAQATGAPQSPIQVKTPQGEIYQGTRIRTDKEATYVLAQPDKASVVIVHAADPAVLPAAERLAANVGNGAGLNAFPAVQNTLGTLPPSMPEGVVLQEARTITSGELARADAQVTEAAASMGAEAQRMAAQINRLLPGELVMARYQDAAKRDWGVVRGQYGSSPKAIAAWAILRSLMAVMTSEALPYGGGEARLIKLSDRQVAIFRAGAALVLLAAPPDASADHLRAMAGGAQ